MVPFPFPWIYLLLNGFVHCWIKCLFLQLRNLRGCHQSRVGSMDWNNHILTTGGMDGQIVNNDVRIRSHIVETYRGHHQEVCGLKWSASGQQLASGGNDNLLHIWDRSTASSNSPTQWLHRLEDHTAAVKALAWCPFQGNLLASGGGGGDRCIKFWNTHTGACLNSVDTGSQVCSLLWNKNERELLSSHGFTQNQLTLWKYPSMVKIAELTGHTSRVLFMAQVQFLLQMKSFYVSCGAKCCCSDLIFCVFWFRAQMDVQWHLLQGMKLSGFGMFSGLLKWRNLHQRQIRSHLLTWTAFVERDRKQWCWDVSKKPYR